jgi:hypothetical protein
MLYRALPAFSSPVGATDGDGVYILLDTRFGVVRLDCMKGLVKGLYTCTASQGGPFNVEVEP